MKSFKKFLEEITIKGSPGVPGEGDKQPGDKDYLSDIEKRAKDRMGITGRENPMQLGRRVMELLGDSIQMVRGKESKLEELAESIILNHFGDILHGVKLDIKLVKSGGDVAEFMDEESEDEKDMPSFREVTDPELIRRIHKAKIGNVIIQGEAKNTKHILHSEESKLGINDIFGEQRGDEIFTIWDEITKLADKMDWIIPIEAKADMMERAPEGMAGAVKVDWEKEEEEQDEQEQEEQEKEIDLSKTEDDEPMEESFTPVIRARGIDFPMLLHETVKGIFELIAAVSQPGMDADEKEIEQAETVKINVSSFLDEAEDFRTGPEIAADFRDFINKNSKASYTPNMRAFIFGKMMDPNYMSSEEFLKLFRGILNETPEARKKVDSMIDEIISDLKSYELGEALPDYHDKEEDTEFQQDVDSQETYDSEEEQVDLSDLPQRRIQELIDDALDSGDYDEVKKLSQYLKEGKNIYLKELERINEGRYNKR
jgi:hypothetical protein